MAQGMVSDTGKVHLNLARLKKGSENFEVDVDPEKAMAFKKEQIKDIRDVLKVEKVFSDAKKGMLASEKVMQQFFKTSDALEVAKIIIKEGEIQLNEEYRKKKREEKRKRLISIIHTNGVDPKTHLPHPANRIENAFEEAKIRIDEYKPAEMQINDVLKKIRPILPIRFEVKEIAVKIPAEYAAKIYGLVKSSGKILKEDWLSDGSWAVVIEIPGGLETEFYDKINAFTHGNNEAKVLKIK